MSFVVRGVYFNSFQVMAANSPTIKKSKGITLSPLRAELGIEPGTVQDGTLKVTNSTDKQMTIDFSAEEFRVINQQYDYAFTIKSDVTKWVRFTPSEINLAAGKSGKISYSIGVPLSAEPGGRYICLFASTNVSSLNSSIGNSQQRVASLLYITVLGNVTRIGNLVSLKSPWVVIDNGSWSAMLQNTGTTHYHSHYSVIIQDIFGKKVSSTTEGDSLILPKTVRAISNKLPLPVFPGIYKIIYNIGLGNSPTVVGTRYLLYLPSLTIIIIVVAIATLCLIRFIVKRNKH